MKHGKKPTRNQKILLKSVKLSTDNWLIVQDTQDEMHIVNRTSGKVRVINK